MKQLRNSKRALLNGDFESSVNIDFLQTQKIIPPEHSEVTVDLYQRYLKEREEADKYRFFFSLVPICSNVLYNMNSEIVNGEGTDDAIELTDEPTDVSSYCSDGVLPFNSTYSALTRNDAIRDTEYSNSSLGNFTYHCGIDIFNNHLLRQTGYAPLQKYASGESKSDVYNTLSDYARDSEGNIIVSNYITGKQSTVETGTTHKYTRDNTLSYEDAISANIEDVNGWIGFRNTTVSALPLGKDLIGNDITIDRVLGRNKACEFYDLYPDRELFSFLPKINKNRYGREERNWDFCLTYPAETAQTYNGCDFIYGDNVNGIKVINAITTGGSIYIRTVIKHNLSADDSIHIYYSGGRVRTTVTGLGDISLKDKEHWFRISTRTISGIWDADADGNVDMPTSMRVVKIVDEMECRYAFRKFRKIPNYAAAGRVLDDDYILDDDEITYYNSLTGYTSALGKMGFSRTIYGDTIAELIYNDKIDVKHLLDHRGRPISEIFLTIVKRNKGYKEWYLLNQKGSSAVEYSHCFGKVSAGLNLTSTSGEYKTLKDELCDYNVHTIHNVANTDSSVSGLNIPASGKKLDDDITIDDEEFIGDIVEWSISTLKETTIEDVYFRFNTFQREDTTTSTYTGVTYDEIDSDDYDYSTTEVTTGSNFSVSTHTYGVSGCRGNVFPEGYYYKPHYKIVLKEYSDDIEEYQDTQISYYEDTQITNDEFYITTSVPYALSEDDVLRIRYNGQLYSATIVQMISNVKIHLKICSALLKIFNGEDPFADHLVDCYTPYIELPLGAQFVEESNGLYYYKPFKTYTMCENERLKNATFTNGAIYLEDTFVLFNRRQDPTGEYGLNYITGELAGLMPLGKTEDITDNEEYVSASEMSECN